MNLPYVWDYDLDETMFRSLLEGNKKIGRLDSDWAAIRLLEYGSYPDILRLMGFARILEGWPQWRSHIRSTSRLRSFDFLTLWLKAHPPEWNK